MAEVALRWKLADDEGSSGQGALFPDETAAERHVGTGEYRGMEFLHVNAKSIINEVPAASRVPFRFTINAYRGCSHACAFCVGGETRVLMADGRTRAISDLEVGDSIVGTEQQGRFRRYVTTEVLAHWRTMKPAYRITLADDTALVASAEHRFLSDRGWKHVTGTECGEDRRPHLTLGNRLLGPGGFVEPPKGGDDYQRGYLSGMIRGDANLAAYTYPPKTSGGQPRRLYRFRLALADLEAIARTKQYLAGYGVVTTEFQFSEGNENHAPMRAIRASSRRAFERIGELIDRPRHPSVEWSKGFLAGIFDAEGSCHNSVLRIHNNDANLLEQIQWSADRLDFDNILEARSPTRCGAVRIRGGLAERLRFFLCVDPAITRKRTIQGAPMKRLGGGVGITAIEPLGLDLPMYDITTGTGDFIANGVVSHNCFARPTHEYLGLNIGDDFDRKIVVKINAVERVRAELKASRWAGHHIAMGTNTDPYQRCEGKYHLTRGIIEALGEAANPFSILTKSTLILRDLDVLQEAAARTDVHCNFSIGTLDEEVWKASEPGTPHPRQRVEAVRKLNQAGIPCGVLMAPVLPGLSDRPEQVRAVVEACVEAGAVSITPILLHLRGAVRDHFLTWLQGYRPDLVGAYEARYQRAYLPAADQKKFSQMVNDWVGEARRQRRRRS